MSKIILKKLSVISALMGTVALNIPFTQLTQAMDTSSSESDDWDGNRLGSKKCAPVTRSGPLWLEKVYTNKDERRGYYGRFLAGEIFLDVDTPDLNQLFPSLEEGARSWSEVDLFLLTISDSSLLQSHHREKIKRSAEAGSLLGLTMQGSLYFKDDQTKEQGKKLLELAAEDGFSWAQYVLGKCLHQGDPKSTDGLFWLGEAAQNAHGPARHYLASQNLEEVSLVDQRNVYMKWGKGYEESLLTHKDDAVHAFNRYKYAADKLGDKEAFVKVADFYKMGIGTKKKISKAIAYYEKALLITYDTKTAKKLKKYSPMTFLKVELLSSLDPNSDYVLSRVFLKNSGTETFPVFPEEHRNLIGLMRAYAEFYKKIEGQLAGLEATETDLLKDTPELKELLQLSQLISKGWNGIYELLRGIKNTPGCLISCLDVSDIPDERTWKLNLISKLDEQHTFVSITPEYVVHSQGLKNRTSFLRGHVYRFYNEVPKVLSVVAEPSEALKKLGVTWQHNAGYQCNQLANLKDIIITCLLATTPDRNKLFLEKARYVEKV